MDNRSSLFVYQVARHLEQVLTAWMCLIAQACSEHICVRVHGRGCVIVCACVDEFLCACVLCVVVKSFTRMLSVVGW